MWGEITGLESTPALAADIPEAAEVRDKISLLKGVLQWQLERDFKDRLWRLRRDVRQTGEALVETQRSRRQIDDTMRTNHSIRRIQQPRVWTGTTHRRHAAASREAMAAATRILQSIAVGELQAQKQRLDIYTVQARFALAAIYDVAATDGEASREYSHALAACPHCCILAAAPRLTRRSRRRIRSRVSRKRRSRFVRAR